MKFFSRDPFQTDLLNQSSLLLPDHGFRVSNQEMIRDDDIKEVQV